MLPRFTYEEAERPVVFQIYGDDPDEILKAALRVQELSPDIIDINMGCPAKTVANRGAGVGLMRTPLKVAHIFRDLSAALEVPVTGKIRLGWEDCRSYKLIARIIEENGGAAIAVHGRTKEQGYGGRGGLGCHRRSEGSRENPGHRQRGCENRRRYRPHEEIHRLRGGHDRARRGRQPVDLFPPRPGTGDLRRWCIRWCASTWNGTWRFMVRIRA